VASLDSPGGENGSAKAGKAASLLERFGRSLKKK
jgi:hypothetical protein